MAKKFGTLSWASVGVIASVLLHAMVSTSVVMAAPADNTASVRALVKRLLPASYHNAFDFQLVDTLTPPTADVKYDLFRVSNNNGTSGSRILIEGATLSALTRGLKYYLEEGAQVTVEWSGNRLNELPKVPPAAPAGGQVQGSFVPHRYYTNVVSFGYQFPFWSWKRWEQEIDWMALNGINMLPAYVGQEYVFRELYRSLNLTDAEIARFFGGPAFAPWQRMGNIDGSWNDKLLNISKSTESVYKFKFIDEQWALQQLILPRLAELGVSPLMPTFQGFVPKELSSKFPNNVFKKTGGWPGFPIELSDVTYVAHTDPLFAELQAKFLKLQDQLNGGHRSKYYFLDLFNEVKPDCTTAECVAAITTAVSKSLQGVDKDAVWVMQSWFIGPKWLPIWTDGYFKGIKDANQQTLVFDLAAEVWPAWEGTNGFHETPFGWSVLSNFGTAQGLFARLPQILSGPAKAFNAHKKNFKAMGVAAEGIYNNEFVYAALLDIAWRDPNSPIDAKTHLEQYVRRRYGSAKATPSVLAAYGKYLDTVWNVAPQASNSRSFVERAPTLNMTKVGEWMPTIVYYNKTKFVEAWDGLVRGALFEQKSRISASWKFDLVDATREVLLFNVFPAVHESLVTAYRAKDLGKVRKYGKQLLQLVRDTDRVLNTNTYFSLNTFIRDSHDSVDPTGRLGGSVRFSQPGLTKASYQRYLESNVKDIFTWWGAAGTGHDLPDYASKQWGGMLSSFYYPRWQLFVRHLEQAVKSNTEYDAGAFTAQRLQFEAKWQARPWGSAPGETLSTNGQETTEVVREIYHKYAALAYKAAVDGTA
ncbi:hypothetical protein DFQ27_002144 [Actinomortierella ambigua]|uniref:Alpha-N-acetylglucosaminidase n=1 Tax=Actinomortierella ambigua TaxID=1343610 RepID=A0A9P6U7P7_9FUNG|nr:hypothetical protein DFQ27_002144 [Actinomortierella ambigua]